jgi:hypothetical protein
MSYRELVIIGAPRSGTNMLRDVLCRLPGLSTWPCDEVNFIWRYGNAGWPSDELPAELATERVRRYINRKFAQQAERERPDLSATRDSPRYVVEKTCANSLRVPFVDRVLPRARFVFIHREPLDAIASAMRRWRAPFEWGYTLKKLRFVPLADVPRYGLRFARSRVHRLISGDRRLASWGPRFDGMDALARDHSLAEICALQWSACAERSSRALARLEPHRVHVVRYEDWVASPLAHLRRLAAFLELTPDSTILEGAVLGVSDRSVGKGRSELDPAARERLGEFASAASAAVAGLEVGVAPSDGSARAGHSE